MQKQTLYDAMITIYIYTGVYVNKYAHMYVHIYVCVLVDMSEVMLAFQSAYLPVCLSLQLSVCLPPTACLSGFKCPSKTGCLSNCLSSTMFLSAIVCLPLTDCLFVQLSPAICMNVCLSVCIKYV